MSPLNESRGNDIFKTSTIQNSKLVIAVMGKPPGEKAIGQRERKSVYRVSEIAKMIAPKSSAPLVLKIVVGLHPPVAFHSPARLEQICY